MSDWLGKHINRFKKCSVKDSRARYSNQFLRSEDASFSDEDMKLVHKLAGLGPVVETAMELDTLQEIVSKITYGENGFSVIVSGDGKVIYSPRKEGDLKMDGVYSSDIRDSGNKELTGIVDTALNGETGYTLVKIDGEDYYVAYAPMDTVNWTQMLLRMSCFRMLRLVWTASWVMRLSSMILPCWV